MQGKAKPAKAQKRDDKHKKGVKDALVIKYPMIKGTTRQAENGNDEQKSISGKKGQKNAQKYGRNN